MAAMFVTLTMVIHQLPSLPGNFLKFDGFPIILSGLLLGPAGGFVVGGLADVLNFLLRPSAPYFPLFTLTSALTGALPPLLLGNKPQCPPFWRLWLAIWASQLLLKLGMAAPAMAYLTRTPWQVWAAKYALDQTVHAPLYAWLALSVWKAYLKQAEEYR